MKIVVIVMERVIKKEETLKDGEIILDDEESFSMDDGDEDGLLLDTGILVGIEDGKEFALGLGEGILLDFGMSVGVFDDDEGIGLGWKE